MFTFFRPAPKFETWELVLLALNEEYPGKRYMFITQRRWICPNGDSEKKWVYDGAVLKTKGDEIVIATYISCVREENITRIRGLN